MAIIIIVSEVRMSYSISELNLNTSTVVNNSKKEDVVLTNHRRPVAVIINFERYQQMLNALEPKQNLETLADLRNSLDLVDDFELPERLPSIYKEIEF